MLDGLWKSYQEGEAQQLPIGKLTDHQLQDLIDKLSDEGEDDDRSDPDPDTQADRPYHGEDDYAEETRNFSDWDLVHNNEENEHQLQRPVHKVMSVLINS